MIGISKSDKFCRCQSCNKKKGIMDIKVLNLSGQGENIHLCTECRMELAKLIVTYEVNSDSLLHIKKG